MTWPDLTQAMLLGLVLAIAGCYDVPKPACGFRCGPAAACPADYTCSDGRCRLDGSSPSQVCAPLDAGLDAAIDALDPAPFIVLRVPSADEVEVPIDITVTVELSEVVTGVSATSFTLWRDGGAIPVAASVSWDAAARRATLDPDAPLVEGAVYVAILDAQIRDLGGNPLAGSRSWAFTTAPDTTPPMVTMTSPTDGATGIGVDTTVVATFSEEASGVTAASFLLEDVSGAIAGAVGGMSVTVKTFTPAVQLAPNTVYTARLTASITDFAGNPLADAPVSWTFTTGADTVAPVVVTRFPEIDDTGIPVTAAITARFSEEVVGVSAMSMTLEQAGTPVPATVTYPTSARTARLSPDAPLAPGSSYTVTLTAAITDASNNPIDAAPITWTFTTST